MWGGVRREDYGCSVSGTTREGGHDGLPCPEEGGMSVSEGGEEEEGGGRGAGGGEQGGRGGEHKTG